MSNFKVFKIMERSEITNRNKISTKRVVLLTTVMLFGFFARSQFNDTIHHYVNYGSTGIVNRANEGSSYVLTNAFKYSLSEKSVRLNSTTSWIYGAQQQGLTNNDFTSTLDFNLYKTITHFYYWGLANYDKSYSLKINNRLQAGIGGAYNVYDRPNASLNISDGILYESSNLQINDSTNNAFKIFRNSFRLRYRFVIKDLVVLDGVHFLQNSLSDQDDYIIKSVSNLTFKIRKWLGLTTSVTYNRTQQTHSENLLITFGLTAEKYF
jgi:hypothetical protein